MSYDGFTLVACELRGLASRACSRARASSVHEFNFGEVLSGHRDEATISASPPRKSCAFHTQTHSGCAAISSILVLS